jgi:hypothetical protein
MIKDLCLRNGAITVLHKEEEQVKDSALHRDCDIAAANLVQGVVHDEFVETVEHQSHPPSEVHTVSYSGGVATRDREYSPLAHLAPTFGCVFAQAESSKPAP